MVAPAQSDRVLGAIDRWAGQLRELSLTIHSTPETAYHETSAVAALSEILSSAGFSVTVPYAGIATSFRADAAADTPGPLIALLAEYDALPGIGHGCGHNLIAMMAVAAAIGIREVISEISGTIAVIGTPAEEGGGGKVNLITAGGLDDVDAAILIHPSSRTMATKPTLASNRVFVEFHGKSAHAAASPTEGISALEGLILTFNAVNAMRFRLRSDARVNGVITFGGDAANVIPESASAQFSIRAIDRAYQRQVLSMFIDCAEGAARATGTRVEISVPPHLQYDNLVASTPMALAWTRSAKFVGLPVSETDDTIGSGSTDAGNVSQILPTIQPYVAIGPEPLAHHTIAFREAAATVEAHESALQAARAMALTAVELLTDPSLMHAARDEFNQRAASGIVAGPRS